MGQLDGLADEVQPATMRVAITTRLDLVAEHQAAEQELAEAQRDDARLNRTPQAPKVAERIAALEQQMRDSQRTLVVSSIGYEAWSDLMAAHPPTKAQRKQASDEGVRPPDHNPETFPFAAVAASLGEADDSEVRKLAAKIGVGQWTELWTACLAVNIGQASVPFSRRASALLRPFEQSSTTADPEGSPEADS